MWAAAAGKSILFVSCVNISQSHTSWTLLLSLSCVSLFGQQGTVRSSQTADTSSLSWVTLQSNMKVNLYFRDLCYIETRSSLLWINSLPHYSWTNKKAELKVKHKASSNKLIKSILQITFLLYSICVRVHKTFGSTLTRAFHSLHFQPYLSVSSLLWVQLEQCGPLGESKSRVDLLSRLKAPDSVSHCKEALESFRQGVFSSRVDLEAIAPNDSVTTLFFFWQPERFSHTQQTGKIWESQEDEREQNNSTNWSSEVGLLSVYFSLILKASVIGMRGSEHVACLKDNRI